MSKAIIKPGIVLLIITVIAAGLLGAVNSATKEAIAEQEKLATESSMKKVLASADSFNETSKVENDDYKDIKEYTEGVDADGNTVGYTFSVSTKGFSTGLNLMIGIDTDGVITGIDVLSHGETPGLGANATNDEFKEQFAGKSGEIGVSKGNAGENEIQAITGATITSRAVTNAVNNVSDYYEKVVKGGNN